MNLIEQFRNSMLDFRSYHSLSRIKGSKSFLYIFLLFLLVYAISSIYNGVQINNAIDMLQRSLVNNIPDFNLSNGKFFFAGEMPFQIEEKGFVFIIDTTGHTTVDDIKNTDNGILITEDELIVSQMGKTEITPLSMLAPIEISKNQVVQFLPTLKALIYIIFAAGFIFAFAGKLFGILVLSLVAKIATAIFRQKLTFLNQWNIAIYASTLPTLIKLIHTLSGSPLGGYLFFIYWGLAITYVFLGIYNMPPLTDTESLMHDTIS